MKKSYIYREESLIKKPFLNIFLKMYNDRYAENSSYAVAQKLQKGQKMVDFYAKEVLIFYDPEVDEEKIVKDRVKNIRTEILVTLKQYLSGAKVEIASSEEIIKHQTAAAKKTLTTAETESDQEQ